GFDADALCDRDRRLAEGRWREGGAGFVGAYLVRGGLLDWRSLGARSDRPGRSGGGGVAGFGGIGSRERRARTRAAEWRVAHVESWRRRRRFDASGRRHVGEGRGRIHARRF